MCKIITIGREFGSGGREVGKRLAEGLDFAYYDKELIQKIANSSGFDRTYIERQSEQYNKTVFPYLIGRTFATSNQPTIQMSIDLQIAQQKMLKEIAEKECAVIIGRCADFVLSEYSPFKVFIYASEIKFKINRCYEKVPTDKSKSYKEMEKEIHKIEKQRANYYQQNTNQKWAEMSNYNLCIDTSKVGIKGAVNIIVSALNEI